MRRFNGCHERGARWVCCAQAVARGNCLSRPRSMNERAASSQGFNLKEQCDRRQSKRRTVPIRPIVLANALCVSSAYETISSRKQTWAEPEPVRLR